jgi:hypothetical protein
MKEGSDASEIGKDIVKTYLKMWKNSLFYQESSC